MVSNSKPIPKFLDNLWTILSTDEYNSMISWHQDPDNINTFIIHDKDRFSVDILNKYYKHNSITSFYRNLNIYGFKRTKQSDIIVISHSLINRYNKDSLRNLIRKRANDFPDTPLRRSDRLRLKRESEDEYYNFFKHSDVSPPYDYEFKEDQLHSEEAVYLKSLITEEISSVYKELKKVTIENEILKNDNRNLRKEINDFKSNVYLFMNKLITKSPTTNIPNLNPVNNLNIDTFNGLNSLNLKKGIPNEIKSLGYKDQTLLSTNYDSNRLPNDKYNKPYMDHLESFQDVSVKKNKVIKPDDIKEIDTSFDTVNREAQVLRLLQSAEEMKNNEIIDNVEILDNSIDYNKDLKELFGKIYNEIKKKNENETYNVYGVFIYKDEFRKFVLEDLGNDGVNIVPYAFDYCEDGDKKL